MCEGEVIAIDPVDVARQWLRELDGGGFEQLEIVRHEARIVIHTGEAVSTTREIDMANAAWHAEAGDRLEAACRTRIACGMRGTAENLSCLTVGDYVVYFVVIFLDTEVEWRHTIIGIAADGARLGSANGEVASGALLACVVELGRVRDSSVAVECKLSHVANEWASDGHVAKTCLTQISLISEDE